MNRVLFLAVLAMLVQQSFAYMSGLILPIAAPQMARDLGLDPALAGVYIGFMYFASTFAQVSCGGFIIRYGALRMSQVCLLLMALALILVTPGFVPLIALAAMLNGIATAPSTPASSQILSRYSPPRLAPLVFSIKQTGVPVGSMLAGIIVPLAVGMFGWQGAFVVSALMCLALAVLLQPLRREFDQDRKPGYPLTPADIRDTLRTILARPDLRGMAMAAFAFVGLQAVFASFFVITMTEGLGHSLTTAGLVFSISQGAAIPARILWGVVAGRWAPPRLVLAGLGFAMAAASVAVGFYAPDWSLAAVTAVAIAYTTTAVSWHGVLLAEVARVAPEGRVAAITGGVLSFGSAGMMSYPLIFSAILGTTGSYGYGFWLLSLPALVAGIVLLRQRG